MDLLLLCGRPPSKHDGVARREFEATAHDDGSHPRRKTMELSGPESIRALMRGYGNPTQVQRRRGEQDAARPAHTGGCVAGAANAGGVWTTRGGNGSSRRSSPIPITTNAASAGSRDDQRCTRPEHWPFSGACRTVTKRLREPAARSAKTAVAQARRLFSKASLRLRRTRNSALN